MTNKEQVHFSRIMKGLKSDRGIDMEKIDWYLIERRLCIDATLEFKKNIDLRMGFVRDNNYLVNYGATFGVRKVESDEHHVYQIGIGKLVCYKLKRSSNLNRK